MNTPTLEVPNAPPLRCANPGPPPGMLRQLGVLWAIFALLCMAVKAHAQLPGAIYTTDRTGKTVNGNLFAKPEDVYLNGGPQSQGGAQLPDGIYYFQVTDPSGAVLLSTDGIEMRRLQVVNGYVLGSVMPGHAIGDPWPNDGSSVQRQGVQLMPFLPTPNSGGVYKVWLTPVASYQPGAGTFGFLGSASKTDNFKIAVEDDPSTTIVIRKYLDSDGDGQRDTGEAALPDWRFQVTVVDNAGNPVATTPADPVTGADGQVQVTTPELPLSSYPLRWTVKEIQGAAPWRQTEPSATSTGAILVDGQWCWSGTDTAGGTVTVDFGNTKFVSIGGTKFFDKDADSARDPDEIPLPGFTIRVHTTAPDGQITIQEIVTDGDGRWNAGPFVTGTRYEVTENTPPTPWRQTYPADNQGWSGTLDTERLDLDFGNARYQRILGFKYHDQNGNGTRDPQEPGLAGWQFTVEVNGAEEMVVSGPDGNWTTTGEYLEGSTVVVTETRQEHWEQTEPADSKPSTGTVGDGKEHRFGNARLVAFNGEKYHDQNANGVRDDNEPGLPDFLFHGTFTRPDGQVFDVETQSDENGLWSFPPIREGTRYDIFEKLDGKTDWEQTEPARGGGYGGIVGPERLIRFGNARLIPISGEKYHDKNGNGTRDDNEGGLEGFLFRGVFTRPDGTVIEAEARSDEDGIWRFPPMLEGSQYVIDEDLEGKTDWEQTEPPAGGGYVGKVGMERLIRFGNARLVPVVGEKYHDKNGNGERDSEEPGIGGFRMRGTFTRPDGLVSVTETDSDSDGNFRFPAIREGTTYIIVEDLTGKTDWEQTEPAGNGGYNGTVGKPQMVRFGNARLIAMIGEKYHDQNGNGKRDTDEPGLPGFVFHATFTSHDGTVTVYETASDDTGAWKFPPVREGFQYAIVEDLTGISGWEQTEPASAGGYQGVVGTEALLRFGNSRLIAVGGEKYHDQNGNGKRDDGEPALAGFLFRATVTRGDGLVRTFEARSDDSGMFTFPAVREGSQYVIVEDLTGVNNWEQTEPSRNGGYNGTVGKEQLIRFGNIRLIALQGRKYYDVDKNGVISTGDTLTSGLGGIPIVVTITWNGQPFAQETTTTSADGTWMSGGRYREGSDFVVSENPTSDWIQIYPSGSWSGTIGSLQWPIDVDGSVHGLDFLNIKLGAGGGLTLGFWSNRNGQWVLAYGKYSLASNLEYLRSLNLVNENGSAFDPTTLTQFTNWLLSAKATNMANMLSAQMAAMALNVRLAPVRISSGQLVGGVDPNAVIWAPGTVSGGTLGYATVGAILQEANQLLGQYPIILSGHPMRARAQALKDALDRANNNRGFVLSYPG